MNFLWHFCRALTLKWAAYLWQKEGKETRPCMDVYPDRLGTLDELDIEESSGTYPHAHFKCVLTCLRTVTCSGKNISREA